MFRIDYMGICGLDGRSRAPRDEFMASHIIDTKQLRVAKLSFDGNQVRKYVVPGRFPLPKNPFQQEEHPQPCTCRAIQHKSGYTVTPIFFCYNRKGGNSGHPCNNKKNQIAHTSVLPFDPNTTFLTKTNRLRRDLNQLIIVNIGNTIFKSHVHRRCQNH
ncbi:hypothetical protein UWK_01827 [Desulfocapsa sulfexigens DSM 10523]|uniref:Uncharacterized protein n=1 Tax=Desulfocapsa sulfexigens (strain DSM 10523 / SB164P1) TaxID=1167006 RepID=M1NFE2_DESSD|nr:hypothetical protein UWK_01827 [Desulfocapsa sulfexigens DSM 10523]